MKEENLLKLDQLNKKIGEAEALLNIVIDKRKKLKEEIAKDCLSEMGNISDMIKSRKIESGIYRDSLKICKNAKIDCSYFSGSYLDQASSSYYLKCDVCGLYVEGATIGHGHYG